MIAGPGAAYLCADCLHLCTEILQEATPFSEKALELASRPSVVVAAPKLLPPGQQSNPSLANEQVERIVTLQLEQKQQEATLLLHQMHIYATYFELHYLWIRHPLESGFAFVPRLIFLLEDDTEARWLGDRGGILRLRPDLSDERENVVYQGSARFRPRPTSNAHTLTVRVADPLAQFASSPALPWSFELTL
jgi:hypothetical protein